MRFLRPEFAPWWQLLPVVLAACTIRILYIRFHRRMTPIAPRFRRLSHRSTWARDAALVLLASIAAGAIVFALVRPQAQLTTRTPQYEREDLVIMFLGHPDIERPGLLGIWHSAFGIDVTPSNYPCCSPPPPGARTSARRR